MSEAVVAGHICVDLIPAIGAVPPVEPGRLVEIGALQIRPGGCVANTGCDLAALGASVRLVADVGDDHLGDLLVAAIAGPRVDARAVARVPGGTTSYSVVISPSGADRSFWHHPGANIGFDPDRVELDGARVLHVGYPPLLPAMYADGGERLERLFARARAAGITTSMDLVTFAPGSPAAAVDWSALLTRILPLTDVFIPSATDIAAALGRSEAGSKAEVVTMAQEMVDAGVGVVVLKDGERGLCVRSGSGPRLATAGHLLSGRADEWSACDIWEPALPVDVVGTTGAGDAAAAGFLAAALAGRSPAACARAAAAAGAARVSAAGSLPLLGELDRLWPVG